jgi:hypothetical protein
MHENEKRMLKKLNEHQPPPPFRCFPEIDEQITDDIVLALRPVGRDLITFLLAKAQEWYLKDMLEFMIDLLQAVGYIHSAGKSPSHVFLMLSISDLIK